MPRTLLDRRPVLEKLHGRFNESAPPRQRQSLYARTVHRRHVQIVDGISSLEDPRDTCPRAVSRRVVALAAPVDCVPQPAHGRRW